ncbi:MAG TPA: YhgE/Pip family protein [Baekduia sp.]|uniref:YhgE/Pip family protein n=1 Tax=Baekduia sp. TaxID=2600305 RepID=UPI002D77A86E|nr:YhgE/Pip family protein [Baekduia sp.]HET6507120.1 YhgE/Pip family protein [Baekduia sp.]
MTALRLALYELRRFRGSLRRAGLAFLLIVPSLYAGVYLWSSWNPYGHLKKIPVAVVNEDRPVTAQGKSVHAGQDFVAQLKASRQFDWHFVDADRAHSGLKSGDYLFTITVPEDFSSRLSSVASGPPERARLDIELDDANNYIVGIIAATARSELQSQVNAAAQSAYVEATLGSLTELRSQLKEAADGAGQLRDGAKELHTGARKLSSGLATLQSGAGDLTDGADQVAGGTQELADTADAASRAAADVRSRAKAAVAALLAAHPDLADDPAVRRLRSSSQATNQQLDAAVKKIDQLNTGAHQVASGAKKLESGIGDAHDGAKSLSSGASRLQSGAGTLATKLRQGYKKIPSPSAADRSRDADVLANPVTVATSNLHPAGVYGRGVAPFFLSIGLWVFGLVAYILLRPVGGEALASTLPSRTVAVGAWLPAALVGAGAATVMFGVLEALLGLHADRPLLLLGLLWLTVLAFTAIVHALRLALGAVGEVVVLILLVLQLGGAGGLYPLQIAPGFFDVIHPILPMTYTIDAFRHAISGGEPGVLTRDLVVTVAFLLGALAVATWAVSRQRVWTIGRLRPELEV